MCITLSTAALAACEYQPRGRCLPSPSSLGRTSRAGGLVPPVRRMAMNRYLGPGPGDQPAPLSLPGEGPGVRETCAWSLAAPGKRRHCAPSFPHPCPLPEGEGEFELVPLVSRLSVKPVRNSDGRTRGCP